MIKFMTTYQRAAALLSVVLVSVVSYLPAVDNFFISDDFGLFTVIEAAERSPRWFVESTTEFFRLMSYIYFAVCLKFFGFNSEPYYWAGIALHAIVSVLVYLLIMQMTRSSLGAWAGALFFAAYERHQEAIMWISAANETILALNCVVFFLLWQRAAESRKKFWLVPAFCMFAIALFSKEAAVALLPLAVLQLLLVGCPLRVALQKSMPLVVMVGAFGALWLAVVYRNFFVTQGHYGFSWRFITVYTRTIIRLSVQIVPLLMAWILMRNRRAASERSGDVDYSSWKSALVFFGALLILSVAPYSFLTYLDHIPSRNTYLPSIGLAGINGIIFASLWARARRQSVKVVAAILFLALVSGNIVYIWVKKEPQYVERAAPTRELIQVLNQSDVIGRPVHVCQFPLDPWTFTEAVTRFTSFRAGDVVLDKTCDLTSSTVMQWDPRTAKYITNFNADRPDAAGPLAAKP